MAIAELISATSAAQGPAARRFALDRLARALLASEPGALSPAQASAARVLGVDPALIDAAEAAAPPHSVRAPLVDVEDQSGTVRTFLARFEPGEGRAASLPFTTEGIAEAAGRAPPLVDGSRVALVAARPLALRGAHIDGPSLGAAAFVSAMALFTERRVRPGVAVSGAVLGGALLAIGHIARKVEAAEQGGMKLFVVPAANEREALAALVGTEMKVVGARDLDELAELTLEAHASAARPEDAVASVRDAFRSGWRGFQWPAIAELTSRTLTHVPRQRADLRVELLSRLGAAERHQGAFERSLRALEHAERLLADAKYRDAIPDLPIALYQEQRAMTELRLLRFSEAARAAKRAVSVARGARLRGEHIKALGCAGLVAMARGRDDDAARVFAEALERTLDHEPGNAARSRAYLIEALGRAGRLDEARAQNHEAMREVERGDAAARERKEAWVRVSWAAALHVASRWDEVVDTLDVPSVHAAMHDAVLPGLTARRRLGEALFREGRDPERGLFLLSASPTAYGSALHAGLRFTAALNVLLEASLRSERGALPPDVVARASRSLADLPTWGAAPRMLGAAVRRAERALSKGAPDAQGRAALRALFDRCERLA